MCVFYPEMDLKERCSKAECCTRLSVDTENEERENSQCTSKVLDGKCSKSKVVDKRIGRGIVESGLTHECGVFGAIACGEWPTKVSRMILLINTGSALHILHTFRSI